MGHADVQGHAEGIREKEVLDLAGLNSEGSDINHSRAWQGLFFCAATS